MSRAGWPWFLAVGSCPDYTRSLVTACHPTPKMHHGMIGPGPSWVQSLTIHKQRQLVEPAYMSHCCLNHWLVYEELSFQQTWHPKFLGLLDAIFCAYCINDACYFVLYDIIDFLYDNIAQGNCKVVFAEKDAVHSSSTVASLAPQGQ